jgi:TP901 family phage tail tape measure protein
MAGEGVLPPVEGTLVWSVSEFIAANDEAIASLRELAAATEESAGQIKASLAGEVESETAAADSVAADSARMAEEQRAVADSSDELAAGAAANAAAMRESADDTADASEDMAERGTAADAELAASHDELADSAGLMAATTVGASEDVAAGAEDMSDRSVAAVGAMAAGTAEGSNKAVEGFQNVGKWALLGGAAVGAVSVKMAMDWQQSMTQLVTGAGESQKGLAAVSNSLLNMSVATNTSLSQLSAGMYMVASAGYRGAAGLEVLQAAAEGAKVGNADLGTMANVVTSALKAYHEPAADAVSVTDQLVAAVANGKMHMQDLATALANVLPVAASAHVSFAQVGGAMATMTDMGMSARRASMELANMLRSMVSPSATASAEMQRLGLSANQIAQDLGKQGITGTLAEMTDAILKNTQGGAVMATGFENMTPAAKQLSEQILEGKITTGQLTDALKNLNPVQAKLVTNFDDSATSATGMKQTFDAAMKTMVGGATGLNVALMLGGQNASTFTGNVASISDAAAKAGKNVTGWSLVQKDLAFQLGQFDKLIQADAVRLGSALIPALETAIHVVSDITTWFDRNRWAADALGVMIGGVLTAAVAAYIYKEGQMVASTVKNYAQMISKTAQWVAAHTGGTAKVVADNEEETASTEETAEATAAANEKAVASTEEATAAITASNDERIASNQELAGSEAAAGETGSIAAMGEDASAASGDIEGLAGSMGRMGSMLPALGIGIAGVAGAMYAVHRATSVTPAVVEYFTQGVQNLNASNSLPSLTNNLAAVNSRMQFMAQHGPSTWSSIFPDASRFAAASALMKAMVADATALGNYKSNVSDFSSALGLTSNQVNALADSLGIKLYDSLNKPDVTAQLSAALAKLAASAGTTSSTLIAMADNTHQTLAQVAQGVASAGAGAAQAWGQFSSQIVNTTGMTTGQIKSFYSSQETEGASFASNIQKAIAEGYNPSYIETLLQQGPTEAGSLLQQLVSAQGTGMMNLVNQTQATLAQQGALAVTEAEIAKKGVDLQGTSMASNLNAALALAVAATSSNASAQIATVMNRYHLGFGEVNSIAKAYGLALPESALDAIGPTGGAFGQLGAAAAAGMAAGINNGLPLVISTVDHLVSAAVQAGSGHLRAASPSRLTAEKWGWPAAEGAAVGLSEKAHLFSEAAASMLGAGVGLAGSRASGSYAGGPVGGTISSGGNGVTVNFNGGIHIDGTNLNASEIAEKVREELLELGREVPYLFANAGRRI